MACPSSAPSSLGRRNGEVGEPSKRYNASYKSLRRKFLVKARPIINGGSLTRSVVLEKEPQDRT